MKIGIIGGGSIGLLFAYYLAKQNDVTVYVKTEHQADLLTNKGVTLEQHNASNTRKVQATTNPSSIIEEELVLIAVKQYALKEVIKCYKGLDIVPAIVFLQNGMGHLEYIEKLNTPNILLGVVEHGALKVDDRKVIHTGIGKTKLAASRGDSKVITNVIHSTDKPAFNIELIQEWYSMISEKLVVNAVINPLTGLYRVENGELIQNQYFKETMSEVFTEITSVIEVDSEKMWSQVIQICKNTSMNRSSMLRDIEKGRKTEVDAILGYVLKQAERKRVYLPITSFLFNAIKGIEGRGS
ncbi:2-dehydropantoate 2-reductase [Fredinandcohnia sp. 179-A 10B2 NHS]|uniref:2-dehydropantoate 2-reductase n=1 Tax=Fredinandcohnia sp. 179-A 10B2 NHS TaxID=3235176 RepID=UPI00399F0483